MLRNPLWLRGGECTGRGTDQKSGGCAGLQAGECRDKVKCENSQEGGLTANWVWAVREGGIWVDFWVSRIDKWSGLGCNTVFSEGLK